MAKIHVEFFGDHKVEISDSLLAELKNDLDEADMLDTIVSDLDADFIVTLIEDDGTETIIWES